MRSGRLWGSALCVALVVVLGACGAQAPDAASTGTAPQQRPTTTPTSTPSPSPSPTPSSAISARGLAGRSVDETFRITDAAGAERASFRVTGLTVDPPCTSGSTAGAVNGHFVRIDLEGATTARFTPEDLVVRQELFRAYDAAGSEFTGDVATPAALACLADPERLPLAFGPDQQLSGSVVVDVPSASGVLAIVGYGSGGWEWTYPQQ